MRQKGKQQRGFTLLEILAVLMLLAFIILMVAPNVINLAGQGQIKATKAQIGALKSVLNHYYLDNGMFPTTEQGLKALVEQPSIPPVPSNWSGPYTTETKLPKDAWGHEIKYLCPGTHNPQGYDIYSLGPTNAEGGAGVNAAIGNW